MSSHVYEYLFFHVLYMLVTAFQRDVARLLVDRMCTLAAKLVQRAMHLDQVVTMALHDMHMHGHMFEASSHQEGRLKHLCILLHLRCMGLTRRLIVLAATPKQTIPIREGAPHVLRPL
jgi:hypothetical protein